MITQLSIVHFKAIASATIPLGPITVLVGPNDSGKSTILQALMVLSRAGGPLRLGVEPLLECPAAIASTNGDVATSIKLAVDGSTALGAKETSHEYHYATHMGRKTSDFSRERISWGGQPLLEAQLGGAVLVEGKQVHGADWKPASTELSLLAHSSGTARPRYRAIADDLRSALLRLDARAISRLPRSVRRCYRMARDWSGSSTSFSPAGSVTSKSIK